MSLNQFPRRSFVGSSTLQTFTGNGTQTAYTLSSTQTQNECFVFVDDVAQVPGTDFTVNGTTLTFTSAPANAAEIIVRGFGVPAPITTVSDGSITDAKLATGAIEAKLGYTPASAATVASQLATLVDSAPTTLDTLNELAAALGDDANYATTITTALGTKANSTDVTSALAAKAPLASPTFTGDAVFNSTSAIKLPVGTTAQRPGTPSAGMIRQNSTTGYIEYYDTSTSQWVGIGAFQATGGTVSTSGNYTYHTFTSSGTFTVTQGSKTVNLLTVAGGGGGGARHAGGGGAGGYLSQTTTVATGNYAIVIGGGGAAGVADSSHSANGSNSTALGYTAIGGGGGGQYSDAGGSQNGNSGGSGGGAGNQSTSSPGSGTSGQGNAGGSITTYGNNWAAGGGGGASAVGGNSSGDTMQGGAGGAGSQWLNGSYYAGGGGGGGNNATNSGGGAGGIGGGAAGVGANTAAPSGTANTGGGGGGARTAEGQGAGGSGIVIIRYTA